MVDPQTGLQINNPMSYGIGGDPYLSTLNDLRRMRMMQDLTSGGASPSNTGPSKTAYGVAGGANVAGSIIAAINAQRALNERKRRGVLDIRPEALKTDLGEYSLKAKSAQVPNYAQAVSEIQGTQSQAAGDAALAATSPDQLQAMILKNARIANNAKLGLTQAGVNLQRENQAIKRGLTAQSAAYQDRARQEYDTDIANLKNAVWQNINNAVNSGAQTALMMA